MNIPSELFLALRYIRPQKNANSIITLLALIGVLLGVTVLIVVLSIMTGLREDREKELYSYGVHAQISSADSSVKYIENIDQTMEKITKAGGRCAPVINGHGIVHLTRGTKSFDYQPIMGVDSSIKGTFLDVSGSIARGTYSLGDKGIIISNSMARAYRLNLGSKLTLHSPSKLKEMISQRGAASEKVYLPEEYFVTGIYSIHQSRLPQHYIFMDLDDAADFTGIPWGTANYIYTYVDKPVEIETFKAELTTEITDSKIETWRDLNKDLLGILDVEKIVMSILLCIVVLVAAFSITNTLITVVIQKTREIGVLKSIGLTSGAVMRIFLLQGAIVGFTGALLGNVFGISVLMWRNELLNFMVKVVTAVTGNNNFSLLNNMPATIVFSDLLFISVITILLCTLGAVIPAWRASKLDPAKALRYE